MFTAALRLAGMDIPEETIRRRFKLGLDYFERHYKPAVDVWYLYDSAEGVVTLTESSVR